MKKQNATAARREYQVIAEGCYYEFLNPATGAWEREETLECDYQVEGSFCEHIGFFLFTETRNRKEVSCRATPWNLA